MQKTKKDITRKSAAESFFWFQRPIVPHQVRLRLETLDGGCRLSLRVLGKPRTSNNILTTLHIVIAVKQRKMHGLWQAIYFDSLFSRYVQDVHFIGSLDLDCWGQKVLKKPWRWSCSWAKDGERKLSGPNEAFGHTQRRAIHSCDSRTVDSSSIVEDFGTAQVLAWSKMMKDVDMLSQAMNADTVIETFAETSNWSFETTSYAILCQGPHAQKLDSLWRSWVARTISGTSRCCMDTRKA